MEKQANTEKKNNKSEASSMKHIFYNDNELKLGFTIAVCNTALNVSKSSSFLVQESKHMNPQTGQQTK